MDTSETEGGKDHEQEKAPQEAVEAQKGVIHIELKRIIATCTLSKLAILIPGTPV